MIDATASHAHPAFLSHEVASRSKEAVKAQAQALAPKRDQPPLPPPPADPDRGRSVDRFA